MSGRVRAFENQVMTKLINRYRIESNRLQFWGYSASGHYFITI